MQFIQGGGVSPDAVLSKITTMGQQPHAFQFLDYQSVDPQAYTNSLNNQKYVSGGTPQPAQPAPQPQAPSLADSYQFMGGSLTPDRLANNPRFQQMLQAYQVQGDPYLDRIDPGAAQLIRDLNAMGQSGPSGLSAGGGRGNEALGSGYNAVAGPDFGFTDALRGAMAVSSPVGLGLAMAGISDPFGAIGRALGISGAYSDVGVGGHTDDNPRGGAFGGGMTTGAHGGRHGIGGSGGGMGGHGVGGSRGDAY